MKQHKLIIIRGPAGVGKSTISRELTKKIKAEVIHFDKIMHKLALDYIPGDKWIPLDKFLKADKVMIYKFKEILKRKNLIIDGNFYHKEQIKDLRDNLGCLHYVFTLKADLNECIKRDKLRKQKLGDKAIRDVFKLVSAFDYGKIINTNDKTSKEVVDIILKEIGEKRKKHSYADRIRKSW